MKESLKREIDRRGRKCKQVAALCSNRREGGLCHLLFPRVLCLLPLHATPFPALHNIAKANSENQMTNCIFHNEQFLYHRHNSPLDPIDVSSLNVWLRITDGFGMLGTRSWGIRFSRLWKIACRVALLFFLYGVLHEQQSVTNTAVTDCFTDCQLLTNFCAQWRSGHCLICSLAIFGPALPSSANYNSSLFRHIKTCN